MAGPSAFVRFLQSRLTAHGFTPGAIDGLFGKNTKAALAAFQRDRGLLVTVMGDMPTVAALRATSSQGIIYSRPTAPAIGHNGGPKLETFPRQRDVPSFYGAYGRNTVLVTFPWDTYLAWDLKRRTRRMSLHQKCATSAERAMDRILAEYGRDGVQLLGLHKFGGSLNVRRMRGGSRMSMHSWAIAIDWDPSRNALRTKKPNARLSHKDAEPFWRIWEEAGWTSLGRERDFDWMHVQAARL